MDVLDQQNEGSQGKSIESVLAQGYEFRMGDYIGQAFQMFGKEAGSYIGFTLVYGIISFVVSSIPFLGTIGSLFVNPALLAGYFIFARLQRKNETRSFGNFFDGFKTNWIQLVLQNFITSILVGLAVMIVIAPFFLSTFIAMVGSISELQNMSDPNDMSELFIGMMTGKIIIGILVAILVGAAVSVLYVLAPMFIVFRGMAFWDAMEASRKVVSKNYMQFLVMMIVLMFIGIAGFLLCCLGLLVALPVIYVSMYLAFEDIMGTDEVVS